MTKAQYLVHVQVETALFNAKIAGMVAQNDIAKAINTNPPYTEEHFSALTIEFEHRFGWNGFLTGLEHAYE